MSDKTLEISISLKGIKNTMDKFNEVVPKLEVGDTFNFHHHLTNGDKLTFSYHIAAEDDTKWMKK